LVGMKIIDEIDECGVFGCCMILEICFNFIVGGPRGFRPLRRDLVRLLPSDAIHKKRISLNRNRRSGRRSRRVRRTRKN
jgi:hypothetical protein